MKETRVFDLQNLFMNKTKELVIHSGGFIGTLPDWTVGLLRLKCVLAGITFMEMVSALEPD